MRNEGVDPVGRRVAVAVAGLVGIGSIALSLWGPVTQACAIPSHSNGGLGDLGQDPPGEPLSVTPAPGDPTPLVDINDIVPGGPPPDGIPPLDHPRFESVRDINWLSPKEPVIALERCGEARAYPLQVMTWHEVVNDSFAGELLTVTFCPLCNTAYAYVRPTIDGEVTTFGTSGKLYHSNLVMYDRATRSLWPQVLGQAVTGPIAGMQLDRRFAQIVSWDQFKKQFPDGSVLSRETGFTRRYGDNPYPGYDDVDNEPFRFRGEVDGRLAAVERVLGVEEGDAVTAFPYFRLRAAGDGKVGVVNSSVGAEPVAVFWEAGTVSALDEARIADSREVGAAAAFSRQLDGRPLTFRGVDGEIRDEQTSSTWNLFGKATAGPLLGRSLRPMDQHDSFWFDWAAFHPKSSVWGARAPNPGAARARARISRRASAGATVTDQAELL